jgi:hypothetical protein
MQVFPLYMLAETAELEFDGMAVEFQPGKGAFLAADVNGQRCLAVYDDQGRAANSTDGGKYTPIRIENAYHFGTELKEAQRDGISNVCWNYDPQTGDSDRITPIEGVLELLAGLPPEQRGA